MVFYLLYCCDFLLGAAELDYSFDSALLKTVDSAANVGKDEDF